MMGPRSGIYIFSEINTIKSDTFKPLLRGRVISDTSTKSQKSTAESIAVCTVFIQLLCCLSWHVEDISDSWTH